MFATLLLAPALAQDALKLEAVRHAQVGLGAPSLTFLPGVSGTLDARLACGSQAFTWVGAIRPGQPQTLELTGLGQGSHSCRGRVVLEASDGTGGELPLSLNVWMHPPLKLTVDKQALDLDARTMTLQGSRPIGRVEIEVLGEGGHRIGSGAVAGMVPEPAVDVEWLQAPGEALKIQVTAWDEHDLPGRLELSPWSYAIPHEDVVFASGQADVLAAEEPKLEQAWAELQQVRDRYGDVITVKLYVAGYTDTVGDGESNHTLSTRRARAIAAWFRERGFDGPIYYQGFGETVLSVITADETDEPANRRAVYLLAADEPGVGPELPRGDWQAL
jgi:outer membrane protein OmpA-like peptidoglycan-associated protein